MSDQAVPTAVEEKPKTSIFAALSDAQNASGLSKIGLLKRFRRFRKSGRKMLLSEYLEFGLYDKERRKKAGDYIGVEEAAILSLAVNFRTHRRALVRDKLLFDATLRGLGYQVPKLQAVLGPLKFGGDFASLQTAGELKEFLLHRAEFPLFCKPLQGQGSRDAFAIEAFDTQSRELILSDGSRELMGQFCRRALQMHGGGMMIQSKLRHHADMAAAVGQTIGSIRVITFLEKGQAHVLAAFWKIPVGDAMADNLWRGNYIASVDVGTGQVDAIKTAIGQGGMDVQTHPDTGANLIGFEMPHWEDVKTLCQEGAVLLRGLPLLGWDIAITQSGPAILEANTVPSLELTQYPKGEGFLQADLLDRFEAEITRLKKTAQSDKSDRQKALHKMARKRILTGLGFGPRRP